MDIITILVGILAGIGAGIGLACDILASAVGAHAYAKTKAVDLKSGISLGMCVLTFTVIGSVISSFLPDRFMGQSSVASTIVMGVYS